MLLYSDILQSVKIENVKIKIVKFFFHLKLPNSLRKTIKKFYTLNFYIFDFFTLKMSEKSNIAFDFKKRGKIGIIG